MIELFENIQEDLNKFFDSIHVEKEDIETLEGDEDDLEEI